MIGKKERRPAANVKTASVRIYWQGGELMWVTAAFGGRPVELWGEQPRGRHEVAQVDISGDVPIAERRGPIELIAAEELPQSLRQRCIELATVAIMAYGEGAKCRGGARSTLFGIRFFGAKS